MPFSWTVPASASFLIRIVVSGLFLEALALHLWAVCWEYARTQRSIAFTS